MPDDQLPDVSAIYGTIFKDDPLLLKEASQKIFGAQILRNLLVERAISSFEPTDVEIDKRGSRDLFKSLPRPPAQPIEDDYRKAYEQARLHRKPMSDAAAGELRKRTMLPKPELTADRVGKEFTPDMKARGQLKDSGSPLTKRLKIATIGYRVAISKYPDGGFFGEELAPRPMNKKLIQLTTLRERKGVEKLRRTKLRPGGDNGAWSKAIVRHVKTALKREANVIVLPEFALPPDAPRSRTTQAIERLVADAKHEFALFSGSRHEGAYNRGFLVTREHGWTKPSDPWWHYKIASARGLGENIMGPQHHKLPSYDFKLHSLPGADIHCKLFVAICYDVFDPTTFINYVVQCANSDDTIHENIILVPSFNPAQEFVHSLRDLSFIAKCPVIYVNGLHGDAKLFLFGVAISDLAAEADYDALFKASDTVLADSIKEARDRYLAARTGYNQSNDRIIRRTFFELSREMSNRVKALEWQRVVLASFADRLTKLRELGALRHLITKEPCPRCANEGHADDPYCPNDILYYNIDIRLLRLLKGFRTEFFRHDDFLPLPFRESERLKILAKIENKRERRASQA